MSETERKREVIAKVVTNATREGNNRGTYSDKAANTTHQLLAELIVAIKKLEASQR